jgi:GNAT superfamily N-acetyltransferase
MSSNRGGAHACLFDATVHPDFQHRGVGAVLVREAKAAARDRGVQWLYVDFDPRPRAV